LRTYQRRARLIKYSVIGGAAALAMATVVAMMPGASAQTSTPPKPTLPRLAARSGVHIPAGARHVAKFGPPAPLGAHGPAFEPSVSGRSVGTRVVNGSPAYAILNPWIVGIETLTPDPADPNAGLVWTCTGTVLSPWKVLTAAHCVVGMPNYGYTIVYAGSNTLPSDPTQGTGGGATFRVARTWVDQSYNATALANGTAMNPVDDVAVLTLVDKLPPYYTPVTLSGQDDQTPYAAGTSATVIGYGDSVVGTDNVGTLNTATVPMVSDANCATAFGSRYQSASMVCAGSQSATHTAPDTCYGDSGAPLMVGGTEVGIADWGAATCGDTYSVYERMSRYSNMVTADEFGRNPINLDWTGDGHTDLMGRDAHGNLFVYAGTGFTGGGYHAFDTPPGAGTGWGGFSKLFRVNSWNGDGRENIMGEEPNGDLVLFSPGVDGLDATLIGTGWNAFSDIVVTSNWNGDQLPSLMARTRGGDMFIYNSDGHGGWKNPAGTRIGTGWGAFNTILTPGNFFGNGPDVLLARTPGGDLFAYQGNGQGGWTIGTGGRIGTGWNGFRIFLAPGDINGDDMTDVIGITPGGDMFLYTTNGAGQWITGVGQRIGNGWQIFNTVF
jgi:hypothetical protein